MRKEDINNISAFNLVPILKYAAEKQGFPKGIQAEH